MLTRRKFLQTGLTTGAALPLSASLQAFDGPLKTDESSAGETDLRLLSLPARVAAPDPAAQP